MLKIQIRLTRTEHVEFDRRLRDFITQRKGLFRICAVDEVADISITDDLVFHNSDNNVATVKLLVAAKETEQDPERKIYTIEQIFGLLNRAES